MEAGTEDQEVVKEEKEEIKVRVEPEEDPDIHPHPQNRAVTAIMSMGTRPGTAWPHTAALGRTGASQSHEGPASLTKSKIKIFITTSFFQA